MEKKPWDKELWEKEGVLVPLTSKAKMKKIYRHGRLVMAEVLRKTIKEEGYGKGFFYIRYVGGIGLPVQEVVHKSLFR